VQERVSEVEEPLARGKGGLGKQLGMSRVAEAGSTKYRRGRIAPIQR